VGRAPSERSTDHDRESSASVILRVSEIVIPAIRTFFGGAWPLSAVKVAP
jgi:hypothetical protein